MCLDLTRPTWSGTVTGGAVTSLELGDNGSRQVLVAGSGGQVTVTRWVSQLGEECGASDGGGGVQEIQDRFGVGLD